MPKAEGQVTQQFQGLVTPNHSFLGKTTSSQAVSDVVRHEAMRPVTIDGICFSDPDCE